MKHSSGKILSLLVAVFAVISLANCGRLSEDADSREFQIPWPGKHGVYEVKTVKVESFEEPGVLRGRYVQLMVDPYVDHGKLASAVPVGRFVKTAEGTMVPADYVSLQGVSVHAHFERLAHIDQQLGLKELFKKPIRIGIQANVVDGRGPLQNNAVFDNDLDALLIVPYVRNRLPIALNGGILAHEHFHMIFQNLVLNRLGESASMSDKSHAGSLHGICDWNRHGEALQLASNVVLREDVGADVGAKIPAKIFNAFLLRGLNEGLADFWGWVYTGDPGFIQHSLREEGAFRRLDLSFATAQLHGTRSLKSMLRDLRKGGELLPEDVRFQRAYEVGTRYARMLRDLTLSIDPAADVDLDVRLEVASSVIRALSDVGEAAVDAKKTDTYLSPNVILKALARGMTGLGAASCAVMENARAVEEMGPAEKICEVTP